jgi:hypothetical protein
MPCQDKEHADNNAIKHRTKKTNLLVVDDGFICLAEGIVKIQLQG